MEKERSTREAVLADAQALLAVSDAKSVHLRLHEKWAWAREAWQTADMACLRMGGAWRGMGWHGAMWHDTPCQERGITWHGMARAS